MEEREKNDSFRKGLVLGALLAALALGVLGSAAFWIFLRGTDPRERQIEAKMQELNQYIEQYYLFDYEEDDVESGIYKGLMAGLGDVYTGYYTPEEYAGFMETSTGSYCGIGAKMSQNYSTGVITVVEVFEGSPAEEAGLENGDVLYMVEDEEVSGMDLSLVVSKLKGEEGTEVSASVARGTEILELTFVRRNVEVPTVVHEMAAPGIGYISIQEFDSVTDEQFLTAFEDLEDQGMENLIVDLRGNGGGVVDATCSILDFLLPEGLIVYTEDKYGRRQEEFSDAEHYFDGEMAVLVNGSSASASEIFAGAVKDYGIGTLIGTQTYGKGIVQSLFPLSDGSAVKLTVSRYFTPSGNNIHEVGIAPDIVLEYDAESETDNQLQKAIEVLSN